MAPLVEGDDSVTARHQIELGRSSLARLVDQMLSKCTRAFWFNATIYYDIISAPGYLVTRHA